MARKDKNQVAEPELVMRFEHLEFLPNMNVTVRKGEKWAGVIGPLPAQENQRFDEDGYPVPGDTKFCHIEILDTVVGVFRELGDHGEMAGLLRFHYHGGCRNSISSLWQMLNRFYPPTTPTTPDNFKWSDTVTVVFFRVDPAHKAPNG